MAKRKHRFRKLVDHVRNLPGPVLVEISGPQGSGKSRLAQALECLLCETTGAGTPYAIREEIPPDDLRTLPHLGVMIEVRQEPRADVLERMLDDERSEVNNLQSVRLTEISAARAAREAASEAAVGRCTAELASVFGLVSNAYMWDEMLERAHEMKGDRTELAHTKHGLELARDHIAMLEGQLAAALGCAPGNAAPEWDQMIEGVRALDAECKTLRTAKAIAFAPPPSADTSPAGDTSPAADTSPVEPAPVDFVPCVRCGNPPVAYNHHSPDSYGTEDTEGKHRYVATPRVAR